MVVIIGAGPAGLSAAYHLTDPEYVVLEKDEPGGLCRSFELGGTIFDLGGHAFFTRHDYVRELIVKTCRTGLYTQPREAWVYSHDTFVRYPFQSHLYGLPPQVIEECLVGLYEAAEHDAGPPLHMKDWLERTFGSGLAKNFLLPYNNKLWAYPLDEMSQEWTSSRIVRPNVREIIAGALGPVQFTRFPNHTVTYPCSGGFYGLYQGLAEAVGDRIRRSSVEKVDALRRRLWTDDGQVIDYDVLISTMPLDRLVQVTEGLDATCQAAAESLPYNSLYLVNLVVDRPRITDKQRIYVADPGIPFHKLVLNSNSSEALRRLPRFGIQAEVSFSRHKHVARADLHERVIDALLRMGLVRNDDDIVACSIVTVERAYPITGPGTTAARKNIIDQLRAVGIRCVGRFGEWLYINSDDAVMRGKAQADELNAAADR